MGGHATKPAVKPAVAAPTRAPAPAPKPKPIVAPVPAGPANYDGDRLVVRLLQQTLERGERALAVYTADRRGQVMVATEAITAFVHELVVVAGDQEILWDAHAEDLASLAALVDQLTSDLSTGGLALSVALTTAYAQLAFLVPANSLGAGPSRTAAAPLDESAHLELARHAMGAARQHLAKLPVFDPKDARAQAAAFCAPLKLHLAIASDAADAVTDRRARRTLKPDVEAVSVAMDELAESLGMKPEIPWDVAFASAFDAENALRAELGLARRVRPYSGNVDPIAAVQQVRGIANGTVTDVRAERYTDPTTATQAILQAVGDTFKTQVRALQDLERFLQIKDPPPSRGWAEILLEIGANVALMTAAGAIGGAVSAFLRPRLEALQVGLTVPRSTLALLSRSEYADVSSEILSRGVLARAAVGDALKDGSKELFKAELRQATSRRPAPIGLSPLEIYMRAQHNRLDEATRLAGIAVRHLSPALQQADLALLNVLAHTLETDMPQVAYDRQYDQSMREWQNVKARLDAGPATVQLGRSTERDAAVGDEHTAGVLEIGLAFSADRVVTRRTMRLSGAEPAARAHFRRIAVPVGDTGINQRYDVMLLAAGNAETLVFGVGPDRGLLLESLTSREWRLLRMLAEREPATLWNVGRALRGEFDATSDAAALRVARGFIQEGATYNTRSLED